MKKIFLIVSIIAVLFLVGCDKNNNDNVNDGNVSGEIIQTENTKPAKKIDKDKDVVYDAFVQDIPEGTIIMESPLEEGAPFLWKIPYINIDSKEVEEINNKMSTYIEDAKKIEDVSDAEYPTYYSTINDNILTVVLGTRPTPRIQFEGEACFAVVNEVYNIDIYTGELLSGEEVLKQFNNISGDSINLKEIYKEMYINTKESYLRDEYRENNELLLADKDYKEYLDYYADKKLEDIHWFLDSNKNIIAEMNWIKSSEISKNETRVVKQVNITEFLNKKGNNYYILPDSDKKILEENEYSEGDYPELNKISNSELKLAFNELLARYGHDFESGDVREYFENMRWYQPVENKTVMYKDLSDIEKENFLIIQDEIEIREAMLEKYKNGEI